MHAIPSLVLPYLDREFQIMAGVTHRVVDKFSRYALIACPTVIASPDFFVESTKGHNSIITADDFSGTDFVKLSMRDASVSEYMRRKQELYTTVREYYPQYFDSFDKYLHGLNFLVRRRMFETVDRIKASWNMAAQSEGPFSFSHMVMSIDDETERKDVLNGLRAVPLEIKDSPFVWEKVREIMDKNTPNWRKANIEQALRSFLLKSYFEALCEDGDSVVAFSDFPTVEIADSSLTVPTIPLKPIKMFLASAQVLNIVQTMPAVKFLELISSQECECFRKEYVNFVRMLRKQSGFEKYDPKEFFYEQAVQLSNSPASWVLRILKRAGTALSKTKNKGDVRPLLETAAAQGLIKYIEQVQDEQHEWLRNKGAKFLLSRSKPALTVIHVGDRYEITGPAGAVGPGAISIGNTLHQKNVKRVESGIDLVALASELEALILAMRKTAETPQQQAALKQVIDAHVECKSGNLQKALKLIKGGGKWAFDQATAIGVEITSEYLKKQLGM